MTPAPSSPTILITGFGRYPGVRKNPTAELMRRVVARLDLWVGPGVAHGCELTVSYATSRAELAARMQATRPDAILLLGLAARARWVRIERFARRLDSPLHPDATGQGGRQHAAASHLPLRATASVDAALQAMLTRGIRTRPSPSAGRYLCNAVYASALAAAEGRPVLFVHVPYPRGATGTKPSARSQRWQPHALQLEHALIAVARGLILQARRARMGQPLLA